MLNNSPTLINYKRLYDDQAYIASSLIDAFCLLSSKISNPELTTLINILERHLLDIWKLQKKFSVPTYNALLKLPPFWNHVSTLTKNTKLVEIIYNISKSSANIYKPADAAIFFQPKNKSYKISIYLN